MTFIRTQMRRLYDQVEQDANSFLSWSVSKTDLRVSGSLFYYEYEGNRLLRTMVTI